MLSVSDSMATDRQKEPKSQVESAIRFHMHFVAAFIFMVKALTIINRLPGLDTELQHKEDWQRNGAFVPRITHPSIPDSTLTHFIVEKPRRKHKQHNVNCESSE